MATEARRSFSELNGYIKDIFKSSVESSFQEILDLYANIADKKIKTNFKKDLMYYMYTGISQRKWIYH